MFSKESAVRVVLTVDRRAVYYQGLKGCFAFVRLLFAGGVRRVAKPKARRAAIVVGDGVSDAYGAAADICIGRSLS